MESFGCILTRLRSIAFVFGGDGVVLVKQRRFLVQTHTRPHAKTHTKSTNQIVLRLRLFCPIYLYHFCYKFTTISLLIIIA